MSTFPDRPDRPDRPVRPVRALARGATRRCAYCGAGRLFRRWVLMVPDCGACGVHFEREEGFFLGAYVINLVVAELATAVLLFLGFALTLPDVPTTRLAIAAGVLALLLPIAFYPFSKTIWTAIDLVMRATMGESFSTPTGRQTGFESRSDAGSNGSPTIPARDRSHRSN